LASLHQGSGRRPTGLLPTVATQAEKRRTPRASEIRRQVGLLGRQVEQTRQAAEGLFEAIPEALENWSTKRGDEYDHHIRLKPEVRLSGGWRWVVQATQALVAECGQLQVGLLDLEALLRTDGKVGEEFEEELLRVVRRLEELAQISQRVLVEPEKNDICWVTLQPRSRGREAGPEEDDLLLHHAPHSVGHLLAERLFATKRSVILTSATLQCESSFEYVRDRLGVPSECHEVSLGAPFDYRQVALVYVPTDLPEPNSPNYAQTLHRALIELGRATQGRMLVLLTSKNQLRAVYRAISDPLANDDIVVLGQYMDGGRRQLLERFKNAERAVLLGTQSFWEGVDVPGPALSCLVIARLPFPVPTEPIFAARAESYDDHFNQFVVPQTVLRFRQGFGRLIRTEQDRGVVALLDSRAFSKSYGSVFLNSLPSADIRHGPFRDLPPLAERWLAGGTAPLMAAVGKRRADEDEDEDEFERDGG
jgi:DNA polymerase-3 subunit epsilon